MSDRRKALATYGARCQVCGAEEDLDVHHITRDGGGEIDNLQVLCTKCHTEVHRGSRNIGIGPRVPMVWARVSEEDVERYQRLADRHYDGNLSQFLRKAARDLAAYLEDSDRRIAMQAARMNERELAAVS